MLIKYIIYNILGLLGIILFFLAEMMAKIYKFHKRGLFSQLEIRWHEPAPDEPKALINRMQE